jgi:hypothetical protein
MRDVLTLALVLLGVGLFAVLWGYFLWDTLRASSKPVLDAGLVGVANGLAGILGAAFAVVLGVDRTEDRDETFNGPVDAASVLTTRAWAEYVTSASIIVYFVVGIAVLVVWLFRRQFAPEPVKNLALIFVGYATSVLAIALNVPDKL